MSEFNKFKNDVNCELSNTINEIEEFCSKVDMIEYLSYSTFLSWISFDIKNGYGYMSPLEMEYIVGVFLAQGFNPYNEGKGTIEENGKILENFKTLIPVWRLSNSIRKIDGKCETSEIKKALFEAGFISACGTLRGYSHYQSKDNLDGELFELFSKDIDKLLGFTYYDALKYIELIENHYVNVMRNIHEQIDVKLRKHGADEPSELEIFNELFEFNYGEQLFFDENDLNCDNPEYEKNKFRRFLDFFSIDIRCTKYEKYKYFNDDNLYRDRPILKYKGKYFLIFTRMINWCIKDRIEDELKIDDTLWKKYCRTKSNLLESKTISIFKRLFKNVDVFESLYYISMDGKRCELDGLVKYDRNIILIEAKSGVYSKSARNGAIGRLEKIIESNIEYAAMQANRAKAYILNSEIPIFEDKDGREVFRFNKDGYEKIFTLNVTYEQYSELSVTLKHLHEIGMVDIDNFPWSVSYSDLDVISDFIEFPNQFLHYINFREKMNNKTEVHKVFRYTSELDIFGFYLLEESDKLENYIREDICEQTLTNNIYSNENEITTIKVLDFSPIFNEFYNKSKNGLKVEPIRKKYNNEYYNLVRQLEEYQYQGDGYSCFALKLLDFNNMIQDQIIDCINKIVKMANRKQEIVAKSLPYLTENFSEKSSFGITIVAARTAQRNDALELLKFHISKNVIKYSYDEWLGLCSFIDDDRHLINNFMISFNNGRNNPDSIDFDLVPKAKLKSIDNRKIGRNDLCPCGSGLKYKKCCLK